MRLVWSRQAVTDRKAIFFYIEQWDARAAVTTDLRIREACGRLPSLPNMGRVGRVEDTRELVISGTPYIAAYRIAGDNVRLLRILHGAQQWPQTFGAK